MPPYGGKKEKKVANESQMRKKQNSEGVSFKKIYRTTQLQLFIHLALEQREEFGGVIKSIRTSKLKQVEKL